MPEDIGIIIGLIITILVLISIIRDKNREIEKLKKDWNFCSSLLRKARKNIDKDG